MKRSQANRNAEEACESSPFVHEQMVAVLEAFGLIKIEKDDEDDDDADEVESEGKR